MEVTHQKLGGFADFQTREKQAENERISQESSPFVKDDLYNLISANIVDILWNKIFYLSSFATQTANIATSSSAWAVNTSYSVGNLVENNGSIYSCIVAHKSKASWSTSTAYSVNDFVTNGGTEYVCTQAHTSSASDEPGVGGSWNTYWGVGSSEPGVGSIEYIYWDLVATENLAIRSPETSENTYLKPNRVSGLRITFYLNSGQTNSIVYIGMASSSTQSSPTTITDPTISFVGIKVDQSVLKLCSYNGVKDVEKTVKTDKKIEDKTTHLMEIKVSPEQSTVVLYDGLHVGTIETPKDFTTKTSTFFPYITSIQSLSGSVNLTVESYEFIQER